MTSSTTSPQLMSQQPEESGENIFKLGALVDRPDLTENDLVEGFVLLQLLSLISPSSVDLGWYATDEALQCPNITLRNHVIMAEGLAHAATNLTLHHQTHNAPFIHEQFGKITEEVMKNAKQGSISHCLTILNALCSIWDRTRFVEPTFRYIENEETHDDYEPSDLSFKPLLRWIFHQTLQRFNGAKSMKKIQKEIRELFAILMTVSFHNFRKSLMCHNQS